MTTTSLPHPTTRPRVLLVFGGVSTEHQVSCLTAASVVGAIDPDRYDVQCLGITQQGRYVRRDLDAVAAMDVVDGVLPSVSDDGPEAVLVPSADGVVLASREGDRLVDEQPVDVALLLLHGPGGEDGTIQGQLEMLGLRYTGSGVAASAVGMDKELMKQILVSAGLPVGRFTAIRPGEWERDREACLDAVAELGMPVYVKPARGGSSVGITKVDTLEALPAAIEEARRYDPKVLVEMGIEGGREIECGVLGPRGASSPRVSQPGEIVMFNDSGFYDFEAKYLPEEQVRIDVPADLDPETERSVIDAAARTFEAIGAEGLGRVDLFVTAENLVLVNEINTMPGFTEFSMFPMVWQASGMSYPEIIADIIDQALERPLGLR